ncbi:MAG: glycoside hydrolase family 28 protein [bacterium]|nr:glycoside hydrolase family 28 protein [bacterium]
MALYDVTRYGVYNDGVTNNTKAIADVIALAASNGGGTIYFPAGTYISGSIELKSNMTLYLESGALILGSEDKADYPMITKEIVEGYTREGHAAMIYAINAENVTIEGRGTIDGRGYNWWPDKENEHRPRMFQTILCDNVRLAGITIKNSPMWTVHPICCRNVTIDGITIRNPWDSPNTDGINPESCSGVHISNCTVDVGDDCLTLKSGTEDDLLQKQYPCENIVVTNCTMLNGHGGVVIGSEMSGGVKNVTISNCVFNGTDRGIRIKTRRKRGGCVEDILINNIMMTNVFAPITVNGYYQCGGTSPDDMSLFSLEKLPVSDDTPVMKNIIISNVRATKATASAGYIYGIPESPVEGLRISNYSVEMVPAEDDIKDKPIMAWHIKKTAGTGLYCCFCKDIVFDNVSIKVLNGPAVRIEKSENIRLTGISVTGGDSVSETVECSNIMLNNEKIG